MPVKIGCIVEGRGEVEAVPILIRRVAANLYPELSVVTHPIRVDRSKIVKVDNLEETIDVASRKVGRQGGIFIILDSDDDCPAKLGPGLLQEAIKIRKDLPIAVVLAKREFEAWFLAAAESLRGQRGLKNELQPPNNPEEIRGAKEWLTHQMESNKKYKETLHQPAFTARFDFEQARHADSFDKCYRDIVRLLHELHNEPQG